eukprot:CAMPEP_0179304248 /NCGR_PEP_ID=MMETSP0797-20121207/49000_1 /TAXON_ID=47934 /ORGANISM="Dinophysis acuminata, Strain DAEP01" /LENGTH=57 /DNA_ID=CAMNT_0021013839 /DNA_START=27 /DNA_END=197 /DNA_ORIENTATION=+
MQCRIAAVCAALAALAPRAADAFVGAPIAGVKVQGAPAAAARRPAVSMQAQGFYRPP